MKRLVIMTVGKTHSGKTTFAHALEKQLSNSFVIDQDNHAQFLNTYYKKLQRDEGPNILKHALSKLMVDYAKEHTDFHFIICNSNRSLKGRMYLLEDLFPAEDFVRILVHFDISHDVLHSRVKLVKEVQIYLGVKLQILMNCLLGSMKNLSKKT